MRWVKQHWRGMARVLALVCIGGGVFCGYWWYDKLAAFRRTLDPEWFAAHSRREYWAQFQESIHRMGWHHDAGFEVGACGDESWMEWIMGRLEPGTRLDRCLGNGLAHADIALRMISNQDVGADASAWLAWWESNKSGSQLEWIAAGFRQRGYEVDLPPAAEQIPVLIAILGQADTNEWTAIPREMKYNAFRCLRDSGFEPVGYALSNRTVSAEVERGLIEYARRERQRPAASGVGILSFGKKEDDPREGMPRPPLLGARYQIAANGLAIGLPCCGVALLILSARRRKEMSNQ